MIYKVIYKDKPLGYIKFTTIPTKNMFKKYWEDYIQGLYENERVSLQGFASYFSPYIGEEFAEIIEVKEINF